MTLEAAPPGLRGASNASLLARTWFYVLYVEPHVGRPAVVERYDSVERRPGIEFSYVIRRRTGEVVFRFEAEREAREVLYELSARAGAAA